MSGIYDSSGNLLILSQPPMILIGDPSGLSKVVIPELEVNGGDVIADPSLGLQFYWDDGILKIDVSTGVSQSYVDASLAERDASIEWLNENKVDLIYVDSSLNVKADLSYVDASLNAKPGFDYVDGSLASIITRGAPVDSSANGQPGEIQYDDSYLYICTSTNKWFRVQGEIF